MSKILPELINVDKIKEVTDISILNSFRADLTIQRSYKNGLGFPVTLIDRENIEYTISPMNTVTGVTHEFVIIETISFSSSIVNINTNTLLNAINQTPKTVAINNSLEHTLTRRMNHSQYNDKVVIVIEYVLSANTFAQKRHAVYLDELDISICKQGYDYQVVHPYSALGQSLIVQHSHNENGFNYVVLINDPDDVFGTRYINISNRVFRVRTTKDRSMKPGVYIYTKGGQIDLSDYSERDLVEEFSFAEADTKVPLFKTPSLAKDFGDAHLSRTEEITIREAELRKLKADVELEKTLLDGKLKAQEAEFKKEQLEQQRKLKETEDELARVKMERDRARDEYKHQLEMNALNRKDTHDFFKIIPAITTAVLGIVTLILQIKAKSG